MTGNVTKSDIILVFGGSFDPPHIGHAEILKESITELSPFKTIVVPAFEAASTVQRSKVSKASYSDRKKMCELMLKDALEELSLVNLESNLDLSAEVSEIEKDLPTPNYTVNTLAKLSEKYPNNPLCFLMGQDQFSGFNNWKEAKKILELSSLIVVKRSGEDENLSEILEDISNKLELDIEETKKRITLVENNFSEAKSTFIRENIQERSKNTRDWLSPSVETYIKKHGIYN
jgi:nicotinate-nucleotide adenylyltransferase